MTILVVPSPILMTTNKTFGCSLHGHNGSNETLVVIALIYWGKMTILFLTCTDMMGINDTFV